MALGHTITLAPVSNVPCINPQNILEQAKTWFDNKGFVWADGSPGYDANGQPVDSNGDGLIDVNCLGLVQWALKKARYDQKFFVIEPCYLSGRVNHKYYERVYTPSALPGDIFYVRDPTIVVKESEWRVAFWHVGVIASELKQCGGGCFDVFHSMLPQGPISDSIKIAKGQSQTLYDDIYIGQGVFLNYEVGPVWSHLFGDQLPKPKLVGVYRPKCTRDVSKDTSSPVFTHTDPLIMGLSGSGIRTVGLDAGIYFDHNSNGFAELTGWVAPGSGFLMLDVNGNHLLDSGSELFGDFTPLANGMLAADGFEALAQYDCNDDGKIDPHDSIWSHLRIWQYDSDDGEVLGAPDMSWKITTLDQLGITAIGLDSAITNRTDDAGNVEVRSGYFQWSDGSTGTIAEYDLLRETSNTMPVEVVAVSSDISSLPNLYGYGDVPDLDQAMMRDASGELKALNEGFAAEQSVANREAILNQMIFEWTGSSSVAVDARGPFMDGRKVVALERFYGDLPVSPDARLAISWESTYRDIFEFFYGDLMAQTHLKALYETITYTWNEEKLEYQIDTSGLIAALEDELAADPEKGKEVLSEFARSRRGTGYFSENCFLSVREAFIQQDPDLGWVFDTGGLPVYEHLHQGLRTSSPHIEGTDNADAIRGRLTEGDGYLNGLNGQDVIYGTDRNEVLINETGAALLVAGGGSDTLWAGEGNDILDGGAGRDTLYGEAGDDTYIFRRGSEQDTIIDSDATEGKTDTIWLESNLTPDDIALRRSGNDFVLRILGTSDTLTVRDFFRNGSTLNRVERIQFMDGTVWTDTEMIARSYVSRDAGILVLEDKQGGIRRWGSPSRNEIQDGTRLRTPRAGRRGTGQHRLAAHACRSLAPSPCGHAA